MAESVENKGVLYEFGQYVLDPEERVLFAGGQPVHLTDKVFDTLLYFLRNNGRLLTKDELMTALWAESFVEESNLAKNISRLRKILNTDDAPLIETLPRRGYRFLGDVKEIDADTSLVIRRDLRVKITHSVESADDAVRFLNGNGHLQPVSLPATAGRSRRWRLSVMLFLAAVLGGAIFSGFYFSRPDPSSAQSANGPLRLTDDPKHDNHPAWTKDGRIRFVRYASGEEAQSLVMQADGTGQTVVKEFPLFVYGRWSPDEKKVIFAKPGQRGVMYLADPDGSNEITLGAGGNHDWSADSRSIVYQAKSEAGDDDIFVYSLDTGKAENITRYPSFDADPSLSPDGKQIVFASARDGNVEIYLMNLDGTNLRRLTNSRSWDCHPVFSPDGTVIAFNSDRENENSDIFLMNTDGSGMRKLIDWPSDETIEPGGWSPDGTKIAFITYRDGNDDIYTTSAEIFRPQLILTDVDASISSPSYSPDGRQIVYQAELADKTGELRVYDVEAKRSTTVLATKTVDMQPRFSSDGEWIVHQNKLESDTEIYVIRKDGTGLKNLTQDPGKDMSPSFSPDGTKIAFSSNRGDNSGAARLYTMNADGSEVRQIYTDGISYSPIWSPDGSRLLFTNDTTSLGNFEIMSIKPGEAQPAEKLTSRPGFDGQGAFSPDGAKIVFASNTDGNWEIYVMNSDGSGLLRLTRDPAADRSPQFSPDGSRIIFHSDRSGRFALYEIDLS